MNSNKYSQAISLAKTFLEKNKRDSLHDLKHIEVVWNNCQALIKAESLKVDEQLLKIATYWHDVVIDEVKWPSKLNVRETCEYLTHHLPPLGFNLFETNKIVEIVIHHEFKDTPTNVEGMILQDADKIDATSVERGLRMLEEYKKGITTKDVTLAYARTYFKWINILEATFYFKHSRQIVKKRVQEFWENKNWLELAKELGLEKEYEVAKASKSSFKVLGLKMFLRAKTEIIKLRVAKDIHEL